MYYSKLKIGGPGDVLYIFFNFNFFLFLKILISLIFSSSLQIFNLQKKFPIIYKDER